MKKIIPLTVILLFTISCNQDEIVMDQCLRETLFQNCLYQVFHQEDQFNLQENKIGKVVKYCDQHATFTAPRNKKFVKEECLVPFYF